MRRQLVSWSLCAAALLLGVLTAAQSAANRARGDQLDRLERWCEAQARRNELARAANQHQEWRLLGPEDAPRAASAEGLAP